MTTVSPSHTLEVLGFIVCAHRYWPIIDKILQVLLEDKQRHCGIGIHSTDIQCYCGQNHPNISWKNVAAVPSPGQHRGSGTSDRDSRTPLSVLKAVSPQSHCSLWLRPLLYYTPPLLKKCRHLVRSVIGKIPFVLLQWLLVQCPAKGSVGSGGSSRCS